MKTLLILQGPPASGKTTWVNEFIANNPDTQIVVVSRDAIRHTYGEYSMKHENEVSKKEYQQTIDAMENSVELIINDATNLNPKTLNKWAELAKQYDYNIEYKEFYVPYKEAIKRDENEDRAHHVGKKVIKQFYRKYFPEKLEEEQKATVEYKRIPIDKTLPPAIICDIDGTVAWMQNRSPYDSKSVLTDKADFRMFQLLQILMDSDILIIFVSGREGTPQCRQDTENWIKQNFENYHVKKISNEFDKFMLYMRPEHDYRPDEIIKNEIYEHYIKENFDVIAVFDDRNKVVNKWRKNGLLCCQVNDGDF